MWNWAEEWKEKLNQALIDWQNLRDEEAALLSWLSSKEQTFDLIGETDITNEEQVTMNLNLLEVRTFHFSYQLFLSILDHSHKKPKETVVISCH